MWRTAWSNRWWLVDPTCTAASLLAYISTEQDAVEVARCFRQPVLVCAAGAFLSAPNDIAQVATLHLEEQEGVDLRVRYRNYLAGGPPESMARMKRIESQAWAGGPATSQWTSMLLNVGVECISMDDARRRGVTVSRTTCWSIDVSDAVC